MRGKRARLLRAEANIRYDDGERHYEEHNWPPNKWLHNHYGEQERSSFYRRLKNKWTRTHKVS